MKEKFLSVVKSKKFIIIASCVAGVALIAGIIAAIVGAVKNGSDNDEDDIIEVEF